MHGNEQENQYDDQLYHLRPGKNLPDWKTVQPGGDHEELSYVHLLPVRQIIWKKQVCF